MKPVFITVLILLSGVTFGQNRLDSLWAVWEDQSQPDSLQGEALLQYNWEGFLLSNPDSGYVLATTLHEFSQANHLLTLEGDARTALGIAEYLRGNHDQALELYMGSVKHNEKIGYKKGTAKALNSLGILYRNKSEHDSAITAYNRCLELRTELGDKHGMGTSLTNLAGIYIDLGDYPKALEINRQGYVLAIEIGNKNNECGALIVMASIYADLGQQEKALEKYQEALEVAIDIGSKKREAAAMNNIGTIFMEQGDTAKAIDFYKQSLSIKLERNDILGIANTYNNLGLIHLNKDDLEIAEEYLRQGLGWIEKIQEKKTLSSFQSNLGSLYRKKGDLEEALRFGEMGLKTAKEGKSFEKIEDAALALSHTYEAKGMYLNALESYELFIAMNDSILSLENQQGIVRLERKFEREKEQALIRKEQESKMEVQQAEGARERLFTILIVCGIGLFIIFLIIVWGRLRVTRRQQIEIDAQKVEVEETHLQLSEQHRDIQDSIEYAQKIQQAIMPSMAEMKIQLKDLFVLFEPKDIVAGDFFWMETSAHQKDTVYFAAADCTGHGVPGALMSVVCSNALSSVLLEEHITETGKLLDRTREVVISQLAKSGGQIKDGMDVSLCALNTSTNTLQWSGANNPLWIIRHNAEPMASNELDLPEEFMSEQVGDFALISLKGDRQPIGHFEYQQPFKTHNLQLEKGDALYIFSDGYQDQFGGAKGKKFKTKNLKHLLVDCQSQSLAKQCETLGDTLSNWKGELEQVDDICLIGVKV